jgi:hypothetical protein
MPQCDNCLEDIDDEAEAHIEVVQPMEFKGDTQKVRQYYCDVGCLLEKVDD